MKKIFGICTLIVLLSVNAKASSPTLVKDNRSILLTRVVLETFNAINLNDKNKTVPITTNEKRGNLMGNYGYFAMSNGYIFYSHYVGNIPLSRVNLDGSNHTRLVDDESGGMYSAINILDGWIYYIHADRYKEYEGDVNLCKMDINGENETILLTAPITQLEVVNDYIYYGLHDGRIFKMELDGQNKKEIIQSDGWGDIKVSDGWIYYRECKEKKGSDEFDFPLYRMRTNGTDNQLITNNNIDLWCVVNGWIYHGLTDKAGIFKTKTDGSTTIKISSVNVGDLKVLGDWVFYRDANTGYINKIKLDGSNKTIITKEVTNYVFDIVGDWVYYDTAEHFEPSRAKINEYRVEKFKP